MKRATLKVEIYASEVDSEEVCHNAPRIIFECDDFAFCPVTISADKDFHEKECKVPIDYLINLGEQLSAFKYSRRH